MGGEEKEDSFNGVKRNKRPNKEVAIFGNYSHYYGYRIGPGEEDPRLKAMKKEWFEGKNCLDIGCNSGDFTIAIAQKFCCRSILGIDIDRVGKPEKIGRLELFSGFRVEEANEQLPKSLNGSTRADFGESQESGRRDLFDIVSFKKANFILHWNPPKDMRYDTIIWVVCSYHKKRLVSETTRVNYQNIKIDPEDFKDILLDKIGFRRFEDRTSSASGQKLDLKDLFLHSGNDSSTFFFICKSLGSFCFFY